MKGDYVKEGQKLPMYGKGPFYVFGVLISAVLFTVLQRRGVLTAGNTSGAVRAVFFAAGVLLMAEGAVLWILATNRSGMREHIANNELKQDGVYGWVRNPMYAGMMIFCSGMVVSCGNLLLLLLPVLYYLVLTVMVKTTEEKWLQKTYGAAYASYCRRVNRCIPWFPKRTEDGKRAG